MELSERKLQILKAIIDDYVETGIPVGSRTLSKKPEISFSSATIRNEMADLEEMGLLCQPHTSAGRTPSDIAYRLYVDRMMNTSGITPKEAKTIRNHFTSRASEVGEVLNSAAKAISESTNHISLVAAPQISSIKISRIQIVKITETKAIIVIVTSSGLVRDMMINVPPQLSAAAMERISNMLTEMVQNIPFEQAVSVIKETCRESFREQEDLLGQIFDAIEANCTKKELAVGGAQNIFNYPEYKDISKAQHFLQLLETKDMLYNVFAGASDLEFTIKIGHENTFEDLKDMSIVTATYKVGGENIGSFGVIGPTRMDYAKVVSVLNYVGMSLNDILSCFLETK